MGRKGTPPRRFRARSGFPIGLMEWMKNQRTIRFLAACNPFYRFSSFFLFHIYSTLWIMYFGESSKGALKQWFLLFHFRDQCMQSRDTRRIWCFTWRRSLILETSILFSGKELLALLTGRPFGGDGSNGLRLTQTQKWDLTREDDKKYESLCFVHLF